MIKILQLIKKDFTVDWRQQHPFSGILLFLLSTTFSSYMAFNGFLDAETWNTLFWIILLFTAVNAISKSFVQEERRSIYYYFAIKPHQIIVGKILYSVIYLFVIASISLLIYIVLFGNPITNYTLFFLNFTFGIIGLASAFTMVSAIAFKTSNRAIMMAVLGFPVIIPILVLTINNSRKILDGHVWIQIQGNMMTLLSVDVIIIALSFILFPFIWKS